MTSAQQIEVVPLERDQRIVLRGVSWSDYQRVLEIRGDRSAPRILYSKGSLELTSPSSSHESIKSLIGCLLEVWCLERDIEFSTFGSWTIEDKELDRGIEPDECYVFSETANPKRPDLAIEVVWTSGGIDKLDAYAALGVREVWFWRRGVITVHVLRGGAYEATFRSEALPDLDIPELVSFLDRPLTSIAMREYRARLQKK